MKTTKFTRMALWFTLLSTSAITMPVNPDIILRCASAGKLSKLQEWHQAGVNLQTIRDRSGETLLHKAIVHENKNVSEWLIDTAGLSVNGQDNYGRSPLHTAIRYLKSEAVNWLVHEKHASLIVRTSNSYTPLQMAMTIAIKLNRTKVRADIDTITTIIDTLLKNADGSYNVHRINSALLSSVRMGLCSMMKYLIEHNNADVTTTSLLGTTVLHRAVKYDTTFLIRELVEAYGADIQVSDRNGQTPLMLALERLHSESLNEKQRRALEDTVIYFARYTDFALTYKNEYERQAVRQAIQALVRPARYTKALREDQQTRQILDSTFGPREIWLPVDLQKLLMSFVGDQLPQPRTDHSRQR